MNIDPTPISFEDAERYTFDEVPDESRVKVYGVQSILIVDAVGNEFYVTREGWRLRDNLDAENWYNDQRFAKEGTRLVEGTGHVYRMPTVNRHGNQTDLVVKFSRFAEAVPLHIAKTFPDKMPADVGSAEFNDPFQEFGLLVDLRNGRFGPADLHIMTKHPAAIFSPAARVTPWKLGRAKGRFERHRREIDNHSDPEFAKIDFDYERQYIYLFSYVKGWNAANYQEWGKLGEEETRALTKRVENELKLKGFKVLDHKPSHIILREDSHGQLLRHDGELVYALVDFELLMRTGEYEDYLRARNEEL